MNNTYTKHIISFLMMIISSTSLASDGTCNDEIHEIVGKYLGLDNFYTSENGGPIVSESCKVWPYKDRITISVFAYSPDTTKKEEESRKEIVVAMIDNIKGTVISINKRIIEEDAVTEVGRDSLTIDTARYQLSKGVRAFGIRFNSVAPGASCGEADWNNELTLYTSEGKKLNPVLNIYMSQQRLFSGCIGSATGRDSWEYAVLSIALDKSKNHNYYDLKVIAHIEPGTNMETPPKNMDMRPRNEKYILRYNGKSYGNSNNSPPWWMGYY